jgi:transcriptional regulator with XRE-family HTH domain
MTGDVIKRRMKELHYTQKQLAEITGCERCSISFYVNNKRTPRIKALKRLSDALDISIRELIRG